MSDSADVIPGFEFREVLYGPELVAGHKSGATEQLAPELNRMTDRALFEEVWQAPGMSRRDRSLVTLTALAALGHQRELAYQAQAALRLGITRDELIQVMHQLVFYAGLPAAHGGLRVLREVFEQLDGEDAA
jgi:4-carboxymuconolactone decarboxylase